ncbi:MAG: hypothetical protein PHE06_06410 [Lachnospiraceae bacterium]|nr:hypothetical protein [Lachnospiraceae bacterium]
MKIGEVVDDTITKVAQKEMGIYCYAYEVAVHGVCCELVIAEVEGDFYD